MNRVRPSRPGLPTQGNRPGPPRALIARVAMLAGQVALLAVLAIAPWLFGGVQARVQVWLFAAALLATLLATLSATARWLAGACRERGPAALLPCSVWPLVAALGLGGAQLIRLDPQTLARLSPHAHELRDGLASEENPSDAALVDRLGLPETSPSQPISLYPASTRKDLALLVLVVAAFVLGAVLFSEGRSFVWLCGVLAVTGGALAFFGMVQRLTDNGRLFWTVPLRYGGSPFGPFVNRNNAGGFLLLGLAAALGLGIWAFRRDEPCEEAAFDDGAVSRRRAWWLSLRQSTGRFLSRLDGWKLTALSLTGCIIAGILCSLSRGAVVAMVGAGLVTAIAVVLARRRDVVLWRLSAAGLLAGLGLVAWAGMSEAVRARLATLLDLGEASESLTIHWSDSSRAIPDFWRLGSGLGTYRFVYEPYQREPDTAWFYYAENMYLETLVESGIPGLAAIVGAGVLVGVASWRLLRHGSETGGLAWGVAGLFALSGQAIQALFDFGLRVPANSLALAVVCGGVAGLASRMRLEDKAARGLEAKSGRRLIPLAAGAALGAALIWGVIETQRAAAVEVAMDDCDRLGPEGYASAADVRRVLQGLDESLRHRPDDAQALCCLAHLDIQLYRLKAYGSLCRRASPGVDRKALWKATLPQAVHCEIQVRAAAGLSGSMERIRSDPAVVDHLLPALGRLVLARRACPLLPQAHLLIGELGVLASPPRENGIHFARARRLTPAQPLVALESGLADFQAGRTDDALRSWRKCLAMDATQLPEIIRRLSAEREMSAMLERALPDSPDLLIQVAQDAEVGRRCPSLRPKLLDRALGLVEQGHYPEDERLHLRGEIRSLRGQEVAAIGDYSRAVELRPNDVRWRYELALLLKGENRLAEAHQQARCCALMEPASRKYRKLLEDINHARIAAGTDLR